MREVIHRLHVLGAWPAAVAVGLLLGAAACTLDKQQPPDPVGPSDVGVSVDLVAAPDTLWNNPQVRNRVMGELLNRRQVAAIDGYVSVLRASAKIQDSRSAFGAQ